MEKIVRVKKLESAKGLALPSYQTLHSAGMDLVASEDEWFSPVYAETGPDGAVWVADWYNFIIQHNPSLLRKSVLEILHMDRTLRYLWDAISNDESEIEISLPIKISEDPLSTVALGAGKVIDSVDILKQVMVT